MSNKGALGGVSAQTWRNYEPLWLNTNVSGNPTMPAIGNGTLQGRYLKLTGGLVVAQVNVGFGSTTTYGNGDSFIFGLPFPANRWSANLLNSSTADLPIGTALAWQGGSASPTFTMPLIPTLADPLAGYNLQTNEDNFFFLFNQHLLSAGTGSITNATPATITHALGVTPQAYDIHVTPTAITSASTNPRQIYVDTITSTQFNVNTQTALGSGKTLSFSWKCRAEPNNTSSNLPQLVNYQRPWTHASGHGLYCQVVYEARF